MFSPPEFFSVGMEGSFRAVDGGAREREGSVRSGSPRRVAVGFPGVVACVSFVGHSRWEEELHELSSMAF